MHYAIVFDIHFTVGEYNMIVCRNYIGFIAETIDEDFKSRFAKFIETAKNDSKKIDFHRIHIAITAGPETLLDYMHSPSNERLYYTIDYGYGNTDRPISFKRSIVKEVKEIFNTTVFEKLKDYIDSKNTIKFSGTIDLNYLSTNTKTEEEQSIEHL